MKNSRFVQRCSSVLLAILFIVTGTFGAVWGNAKAADTQAPTAPEKLSTLNVTCTSISLIWSPSRDNIKVKGYQIFRDGKKLSSTSKTYYTSTNLVPGRKYTYEVRAYDDAGNLSISSNAVNVTTVSDVQNPSTPANLSASAANYTTITLVWDSSTDNTGVKGYEVYCNGKKKASTTSAHYVVKSLSPGTAYSFYVKAYDIAGNYSGQSNTVSANTAVDAAPPSIPPGLKAVSVSETEITLTWSPSTDNVKVKRYDIYCSGEKIGTTTKTSYCRKKLIPGSSYTFSVKALDTSLNASASSNSITISTLKDIEPPSKPDKLKLKSVKGSSVALEWTASTDNIKVEGYQIFCNGIMLESTARTSRTVKALFKPGINVFCIKAYDQSGNLSAASNSLTVIMSE